MARHPLLIWVFSKAVWLLQYPGAEFALKSIAEIGIAVAAVAGFWAIFSAVVGARVSRTSVDRDTCSCSCWDGVYKDGTHAAVIRILFHQQDYAHRVLRNNVNVFTSKRPTFICRSWPGAKLQECVV